MTAVLSRQAPTLRQLGWTVRKLERGHGGIPQVRWHLAAPDTPPGTTAGDHHGPRRAANDAGNAGMQEPGTFPQASTHVEGSAFGSASLLHPTPDAAPAASRPERRPDAGRNAGT
jgi:hypothetical protein